MSTAQEAAYSKIRHAILTGVFRPGVQLRQEELAEEFKMSRTAVRFAIQALADDGIVEISDTRRSFVADITETHAEETFDILVMLEPYSAALATLRASDDDIKALRKLIDEMEQVIEDDVAFLDLNSKFHRKIHSLSGNRSLRELIERIVDFPTTLYLKLGQSTESMGAHDDHRRILAAIEKRDTELVAMEMKAHVEYRRREFRDQWVEYHEG